MIQVSIVCGTCQQQISAYIEATRLGAVERHLTEALAAAHHADCYVEADRGREDQGSTDSDEAHPEGPAEGSSGSTPGKTVH